MINNYINKSKLLEELKNDVVRANEKMNAYDPNNAHEAIVHHICKDESKYAQSIIDAIEHGDYDVETV